MQSVTVLFRDRGDSGPSLNDDPNLADGGNGTYFSHASAFLQRFKCVPVPAVGAKTETRYFVEVRRNMSPKSAGNDPNPGEK